MKKVLAFLLAAAMLSVSLVGCTSGNNDNNSNNDNNNSSQGSDDNNDAPTNLFPPAAYLSLTPAFFPSWRTRPI